MALPAISLDDKYTLDDGRIYLSGVQALVRLPMMQRERDRAAGLNTGGFISGYRGSPLGTYDHALQSARRFLEKGGIHFHPGLNEDLAATSVWGSQQVNMFEGATVDGVFGIWYGKGPGVDRTADVFKHANAAGTSRHGGVLALMGDDHGCHSSTLPHQSEQIMSAAMMPILAPATVQDYLDLGLFGFALSRFSGCWVGFKAVGQTVETTASVAVDPQRPAIVIPADFDMPEGGLSIRRPDAPLDQERRLHGPKMAAVAAFVRANAVDRIVIDGKPARLGIVAAGKSYLDVCEAFRELGLTEQVAASLGIRLYKLGLTWPIEAEGAKRFATGLEEILVVEEKRGFIEDQLTRILYNMPADMRPRIIGKTDEDGRGLIPSEGELSPTGVGIAIGRRLLRLSPDVPALAQRVGRLEILERRTQSITPSLTRAPYFCSGCPHNTSTHVPEGSRALAGIGCHGMTVFMPERRTHVWSHMGGEGAGWIGQAPFTTQPHIFQNLGDGTYSHSGLLAIRAAAASGVNITYKILYNDAVAMTGGQTVEGSLSVPQISRQVAAEGAQRIVVVTDEPDKYPPDVNFAPGVEIRHRDELDAVQRELREVTGLTVLIYDQTCAAEKRRRRKRGTFPDPAKRVFINTAVCEACGDCSTKSNCVSVQPVETELGRKRKIDQSSCNKDFSCLNGFCPSFVTVRGGALRRATPQQAVAASAPAAQLPTPAPRELDAPYGILITGIGGTGVITIGALLGMAAHLEGKGCTVLDSAGMAQKNGAVMSHVRIAATPDDLHASKIAAGAAQLVLACDIVVATSQGALSTVEAGMTRAVVNSTLTPTAAFVTNNEIDLKEGLMRRQLRDAAGEGNVDFIDATRIATTLMGDSIATNLFMVGYAFQSGLIPLSLDSLVRAIELNGVSVKQSLETFDWGRRAAADRAFVEEAARPSGPAPVPQPQGFDEIVAHRAALLTDYQNSAYAGRFRDFVGQVQEKERALGGKTGLAEAVARNLYKLMAYKDEYEVARLYTGAAFQRSLESQFEGDYTLEFNLAPPLIAKKDPQTGEQKKRVFGAWMMSAFRILAGLKRLRGTPLDIFGYTHERRTERGLIAHYEDVMRSVLAELTPDNHRLAVEIANVPDKIRGFGHIKARNLAAAEETEKRLLAAFREPASPVMIAAE